MALRLQACSLAQANAFVTLKHRHHRRDRGHKFSVAVVDEAGGVRGVAIAGRPKARVLDDGHVLEVTRVCTDGAHNACSMLYGAVARAAASLGYAAVITYTLESESGSSLRAAGWVCEGVVRPNGLGWSNRPGRLEEHPETKIRWRKSVGEGRAAA